MLSLYWFWALAHYIYAIIAHKLEFAVPKELTPWKRTSIGLTLAHYQLKLNRYRVQDEYYWHQLLQFHQRVLLKHTRTDVTFTISVSMFSTAWMSSKQWPPMCVDSRTNKRKSTIGLYQRQVTCHFGSVGKADERKGSTGRRKYWHFCFPLQLKLKFFYRQMHFTALTFGALHS